MPVKLAVMINSVNVKTTRKDERMAFLTVEDRYGEAECIAFASQYSRLSHLFRVDNAVYIYGHIALREDEAPRIIISEARELIENAEYEKLPTNTAAEKPKESVAAAEGVAAPTRIFLKVPDMKCDKYLKAYNLVSIFEGRVAVIFYDSSSSKYISTNLGIDATRYVVEEFKRLLGDENVALR